MDFREWNQIAPDQGRSDSSIPENPKARSVNITMKFCKPVERSRMFYNHLEGSKRNQKMDFREWNQISPDQGRSDSSNPKNPKILAN